MITISSLPSCIQEEEFPILYALALWGRPFARVKLLELLRTRGEKSKNGELFDDTRLKSSVQNLSQNLLIEHQVGLGFVLREDVHEALRMKLLLRLQKEGWLKSWIASIREDLRRLGEYSHWRLVEPVFCRREMMFSALAGKADDVAMWREKFIEAAQDNIDFAGTEFFCNQYGVQVFEGLDPHCQAILLVDILYCEIGHLRDCRLAYEFAVQHAQALTAHKPAMAEVLGWHALLRGDIVGLKRFQAMEPQASFVLAIASRVIAGEYAYALSAAEQFIKELKAMTGKRKLFLEGILGFFHAIAMLGVKDTPNLKRFKEQVDDGVKQRAHLSYYLVQPFADHLLNGVPIVPRVFPLGQRVNTENLFSALFMYWQDAPKDETLHELLLKLRKLAIQRDYRWLAAEVDVVLHCYFGEPMSCGDWHAENQCLPLINAMQKEESWQRALKALTQVKTGATASVASNADTRIAWLLNYHAQFIDIEPREQKLNVKGIWSKGRPVALKRLAQEQESLPGMSEQDKRIASCIRKGYDNYYGNSEYDMVSEKALPFLVGHPAVFWIDAPDVRIDIVKAVISLQLKEKQGQITLQLMPPISATAAVVWLKETPTRLAVYESSAEIKQIAGILGAGLSVPVNAKAQLVDVIAAIAPHLPINSDLPELAAHIATVPADARLYAHLLPLKEGLRVQILVRPLTDGSWLSPGKGSANVLGEQAGVPIQASRDLKAELLALDQLVSICPALNEAENQDQEWQLSHPEHCLELLMQLREVPEDVLQLVWPEGERFRLKASRSLQQMRLTIKKQGEWFVAGGEITLDDGRVLALRELMQMAANSSGRFLKLGENDYLALTDNFRKRLGELQSYSEAVGKDGVRINPLAAPALAELAQEVGELKADKAWRDALEKLDSLSNFKPVLPSTLQAELRDYQLVGYQWLARLAHWGVGACLADDMGLGKTVQALALLLDRAPNGPALVVAPISVAMNWQAEVARFAPTLKVRAYHSNRSLDDLGAFDIVVASYGMLQADTEAFSAQHWHSVVLDEAQVIKNAATKRSQAAMALTADFKMIASGTPVENHLGELWNLFRFINPGLLGSKEKFAERFSNPIERGEKSAKGHLKKLIQPFILRRTKTQVLSELPSRTEITLQVELSDEERHLYEALRQEAVDKINGLAPQEGKAMQVLAEITKLRRFCCNPKLVLKNADVSASKLAVFAETVEELLDNRHKALVFSQFVDHLAIIRAYLDRQGISYQYLDGSTPPLERKKRVDAFQAGQGDIFLISLKAGGTGLNLTAADYVIHLDPWWNPAVEDQASDRAHRMGQLRPVTIYRLVVKDTIEEKILALHAQKRDLADSLLEGGDAAGKMDTEALLRLLKESV